MHRLADTEHDKKLSKANEFIERNKINSSTDTHRCTIHFMPPTGWMNDPNGLSVFRDEYHMFYQYNPYGAQWNTMHWGHAKSDDLLHWRHLPVALAPSEPYEQTGGCFSGSAVDWADNLHLFYTGAMFDRKNHKHAQTQCHALSSDGINFMKNKNNPLIEKPPDGFSLSFRDPKVWQNDGLWYMVIGGAKDNIGQVLLYYSQDLFNWQFHSVLAHSDGIIGEIWECPDFFELNGHWFLLISTFIKQRNTTMYLSGDFDYNTCKFIWNHYGIIDGGSEFYAPQTLLDKSGERVIFGWLNTWNFALGKKPVGVTKEKSWCGSMSLPRVLQSSVEGKLLVQPYSDLIKLRKEHLIKFFDTIAEEAKMMNLTQGKTCCEMRIVMQFTGVGSYECGLLFGSTNSDNCSAILKISNDDNSATLIRKESDYYKANISQTEDIFLKDDRLEIIAYLDGPVLEIFLQDGQACLTGHVDPELVKRGVYIYSDSPELKIESLDVYALDLEG